MNNYQVQGSSSFKFTYSMPENGLYGAGAMTFDDGTEYPVKFFQSRPGGREQYRCLFRIRMKSTQVHSKSLLVPLILEPDGKEDLIHIGYIFDHSFQEWLLKGPTRPPLFRDGVMDDWWIEQADGMFDTVSAMHDGFLYHEGLDDVENYVSLDDSMCIVLPKTLLDSRDDDRAKSDLISLGVFFSRLPVLPGNFDHSVDNKEEWDDFIAGFNSFGIEVVRKHPVLKSGGLRYDYLRANIAKVMGSWGRTDEEWEDFMGHIDNTLKKYPNWRQTIAQDPDFKTVYDERVAEYNTSKFESFCILKFVESVMKGLKKEGATTEIIERLVHQMFPGISSSLHSAIASYS